jgi:Fe-S cluster assembly ATP-binding protein
LKDENRKSTLAYSIMGHPKYKVSNGKIIFNNKNILKLNTTEISKKGIFLSFQTPLEIPGLNFLLFLKASYENITNSKISIFKFRELIKKELVSLNISESFLNRDLNKGFSGGEKKRAEIVLLNLINPKLIILDEIDSGLDIDSLKIVAESINNLKKKNKDLSIIIITHYKHILKYIKPDKVHIIYDGKIVKKGNLSLVNSIEKNGFKEIIKNYKESKI